VHVGHCGVEAADQVVAGELHGLVQVFA
jgi:hypothetical protein